MSSHRKTELINPILLIWILIYDACFVAERVGLPYLSAYLNSLGSNFRHGANFATGGSTIRRQNETIFQYGISPFSLDMQIAQFDQFKARSAELFSQSQFLSFL